MLPLIKIGRWSRLDVFKMSGFVSSNAPLVIYLIHHVNCTFTMSDSSVHF